MTSPPKDFLTDRAAFKRSVRASAILYAISGWPVIPLIPRQKEPLGKLVPRTKESKGGLHCASEDRDQVAEWWRKEPSANVGIVIPRGYLGIDIDPAKGGEDELSCLEMDIGDLPETLEVATGGSGRHLYFQVHDEPRILNATGWRPGIDLRSAHAGYLVAPPSIHPKGGVYTWIRGPRDHNAAWLPSAWRKAMPAPLEQLDADPVELPPDDLDPSHAATKWLVEAISWVAEAQPGGRNDARYRAGVRAGRLVAGGLVGKSPALEPIVDAAERNSIQTKDGVRSEIMRGFEIGIKNPWRDTSPGQSRRELTDDDCDDWQGRSEPSPDVELCACNESLAALVRLEERP